jgi:aspartyl-tRNA(Asn)/glutamyl-tRNA(Gln) amidotransferase subunit C
VNNHAGPAVFIAAYDRGVKDVIPRRHLNPASPYSRSYQTLPVVTDLPIGYNLAPMATAKITPDDVQKVAKLARLALPQQKLQTLTQQLESILEYVAKIGEVDVGNVEPMAHALPLANVFREDVVQDGLQLEQVLQNAPQTDGPFFKVPKVIGGEEDSAG